MTRSLSTDAEAAAEASHTGSPPSSSSGGEFPRLSAGFETRPASAIVEWAHATFGRDLVLAASFQDCVMIDIATRVDPDVEVVFLDTGFHFPETLAYVDEVARRYRLNLRVMRPRIEQGDWPCGTERCCALRKVEPMSRALAGRRAWMTGLRRADAPTRSAAPIVAIDEAHGIVKINPLATWTDLDVAGYASDHGLPRHPLIERGYLSIGCAPTTQPVRPGADPRSGRWGGSDKTECGLHI